MRQDDQAVAQGTEIEQGLDPAIQRALVQEETMGPEDLARLRPKKDAGLASKERLQERTRAQKIKRAMVRTYVTLTSLILLALIGAGWFIYQEYQKPGKLEPYYRDCSYTNKESGIEITGRREYFYSVKNIFGFHLRQKADMEDRTQIDVRGEPITVVGLSEGKWWTKHSGEGERGILMLKPADMYVITTKKTGFPVNYGDFCK